MGGGLLGLGFGPKIGGSSSHTDRSVQLQSYGNLENLFNWALPFAKSTASKGQDILGAGVNALGTAGGYFKKLLSGNRSDIMAAEAPAINATTSAADASKRQLGTFGTARGGGTAAVSSTLDDKTRATIDNALFGVRPGAAEGLTKVGQAETQAAGVDLAAGLQAANTAEYATSNMGQLALESRKGSSATAQSAGSAAGQILMDALMFA